MEFCQLTAELTQISLLGARSPCKKELAVALKSGRVEPQSKREENHQTHPQTPEQHPSKPPRSLKTRKVRETATAKRTPRRCEDYL